MKKSDLLFPSLLLSFGVVSVLMLSACESEIVKPEMTYSQAVWSPILSSEIQVGGISSVFNNSSSNLSSQNKLSSQSTLSSQSNISSQANTSSHALSSQINISSVISASSATTSGAPTQMTLKTTLAACNTSPTDVPVMTAIWVEKAGVYMRTLNFYSSHPTRSNDLTHWKAASKITWTSGGASSVDGYAGATKSTFPTITDPTPWDLKASLGGSPISVGNYVIKFECATEVNGNAIDSVTVNYTGASQIITPTNTTSFKTMTLEFK